MSNFITAAKYFGALSVGSLITSIGFWLKYDRWEPLAWSALVVACVQIISHLLVLGD